MKLRIIKNTHYGRTWYTLQQKFLWYWVDCDLLPLREFATEEEARDVVKYLTTDIVKEIV